MSRMWKLPGLVAIRGYANGPRPRCEMSGDDPVFKHPRAGLLRDDEVRDAFARPVPVPVVLVAQPVPRLLAQLDLLPVHVDLLLDEADGQAVLLLRVPALDVHPPLEVRDPAADAADLGLRGLLPEDRLVGLGGLREDDRRHEGADPDRVD